MSPSYPDGMADSVETDQIAPRSSLICVCTVRSDLHVLILGIFIATLSSSTQMEKQTHFAQLLSLKFSSVVQIRKG